MQKNKIKTVSTGNGVGNMDMAMWVKTWSFYLI